MRNKKVDKLNIKTITYQRLKNLGDFENERIEITLEVNGKRSAEETLKLAKSWVEDRLSDKKHEQTFWGD